MNDVTLIVTLTVVVLLVLGLGSSLSTRGSKGGEEDQIAIAKRRIGKPDMAYSAGRDAANQVGRARELHLPMEPDDESAMRAFYLDLLGLTEMRAPNYPHDQDGFWAILGARRAYFGVAPSFRTDRNEVPTFTVRDLDDMATRLADAGHRIEWDERYDYARRLFAVDPAGNPILLIKG